MAPFVPSPPGIAPTIRLAEAGSTGSTLESTRTERPTTGQKRGSAGVGGSVLRHPCPQSLKSYGCDPLCRISACAIVVGFGLCQRYDYEPSRLYSSFCLVALFFDS